jgi:hypothetical protein
MIGKNAARQTHQRQLDHVLTPIVPANLVTEEHMVSAVSF